MTGKTEHSVNIGSALSSAYDSTTIVCFSLENPHAYITSFINTDWLLETRLRGESMLAKTSERRRNKKKKVLCHLTSTHSSLEIPLSITAAHCYNQMCYLRDMWPLVYLYDSRRDDSTDSPGLKKKKKCVYTFSHIKACAALPSAMALMYVC